MFRRSTFHEEGEGLVMPPHLARLRKQHIHVCCAVQSQKLGMIGRPCKLPRHWREDDGTVGPGGLKSVGLELRQADHVCATEITPCDDVSRPSTVAVTGCWISDVTTFDAAAVTHVCVSAWTLHPVWYLQKTLALHREVVRDHST